MWDSQQAWGNRPEWSTRQERPSIPREDAWQSDGGGQAGPSGTSDRQGSPPSPRGDAGPSG